MVDKEPNKHQINQTMETFVSRLVAEANDLYGKIEKLISFVCGDKFASVDKEQQGLLFAQLQVMESYHTILRKRLILLGVQCELPQKEFKADELFPPIKPIPLSEGDIELQETIGQEIPNEIEIKEVQGECENLKTGEKTNGI